MKLRPFGSTGLQVSELGLGCARIGGIFQRDPKAFVDLLSAAKDHGINFFDTADMYSQGESETLIGKAFHRRRDQVIIASKVGYCLPTQRRLIARIKPLVRPLIRLLKIKRSALPAAVRGELAQDFSPTYIRSAVEASLKRLKTDHLDILQLHSVPADVVRAGEWAEALESLKKSGKVRFYGISSDTLDSATAALAYPKVSSLQVVVSLIEQRFAQQVLPRAEQQGIGVIAREILANGLLIKDAHEIDIKGYVSSPEEGELRIKQLAEYRETANQRGISLAKLALEYATSAPGVSTALIGVRSIEQLTSTLKAYQG